MVRCLTSTHTLYFREKNEDKKLHPCTSQFYYIQEISLKKIYDEGYISSLFVFSKIKMISNHIAFVLLLFSSANFITDSYNYTIASKNISKIFNFYMLRK